MRDNSDKSQNQYTLSIRVSPDGFFFSVSDSSDILLGSKDVPCHLFSLGQHEIASLLENESILFNPDYNQVHLIVETGRYVFVPAPLFMPQETDTYFNFQHRKEKDNIVIFNRIDKWNTVNVFSLPYAIHEALQSVFPDIVPLHQLSFVLNHAIRSAEDCLHVWVRPHDIDVVVIQQKQLKLMNSFPYSAVEDAVYYILTIFEQLNLDVEQTKIKLYQRIKNDGLKSILSQYIENCEVLGQL